MVMMAAFDFYFFFLGQRLLPFFVYILLTQVPMSIGLGTRVVTKRTKARENKAQESGHKKNSNALNTYLLSPKETLFFQEKKENQQTDKTMSYAPTGKGVGGYLVVKGHAVRQ